MPYEAPHDSLPADASAPGTAAAQYPQAILKPRKAAPFWGRHPWVLDSAIARLVSTSSTRQVADGDPIDLVSDTGQWIARGIYNSNSRIRIRLYSWQPDIALDNNLWRQRIDTAVALRRALGYDDPQGAARLIYSESDQLSGLVVDRYAEHLVVQPTSLAMAKRVDELIPLLAEATGARSIRVRADKTLAKTEGITLEAELPFGESPEGPVIVIEHGIKYLVSLDFGQKTGFYLDQRENRRAAAQYMAGRRVLDVCCYTGGFSLCAAALGGAAEVLAIDTSERALQAARENGALNGVTNVRFEEGDCFQRLQELGAAGERFGAVVLDPPRFVRGRKGVDEALRAYHRLNRLAVEVLEPGGILVTCSCSGSVTREDFFTMLLGVAQKTRREIQVLEQRGAAPDHPVNVFCWENEYLKCFFCRVV